MSCNCIACQMGRKAFEEIDRAHAVALKAIVQVEDGANDIIEMGRGQLSELESKMLTCRTAVMNATDGAVNEAIKGLEKTGPGIREVGQGALREAFEGVETLPDEYTSKLSGIKNEMIEGIRSNMELLSNAAEEKIESLRGKIDQKKDGAVSALAEQIEGILDELMDVTGNTSDQIDGLTGVLTTRFSERFQGAVDLEEAERELPVIKEELKRSVQGSMEGVTTEVREAVERLRTKMESAIETVSKELMEPITDMPHRIDEATNRILEMVKSAMSDTLEQAGIVLKELIADARKRLDEALARIADSVDIMIDEGTSVLKGLRGEVEAALDELFDRIMELSERILDDVRAGSDRIVSAVRVEVEGSISAAREAVGEVIMDTGKDLNRQIERIKMELSREADRQARQIRVMGEEAFAEAEEAYVNAGYTEDTSVIEDIRVKGHEAIENIERTMEEQADDLLSDFEAQLITFVPTIAAQGAKIAAQARGLGSEVVPQCLEMGKGISTGISGVAGSLTDALDAISKDIPERIETEMTGYVENSGAAVNGAADGILSSCGEFMGDAVKKAEGLARDTRERVLATAADSGAELEGFVGNVNDDILETMDAVNGTIMGLISEIEDSTEALTAEIRDIMNRTSDEMKELMEAEVERVGTDSASKGIASLKAELLGSFGKRMDGLKEDIISKYGEILTVDEKLDGLVNESSKKVGDLRSRMDDMNSEMTRGMDEIVQNARDENDKVISQALKGLDIDGTLDASTFGDAANELVDELRRRTEEMGNAKDELARTRETAEEGFDNVAAMGSAAAESVSGSAREAIKKALSDAAGVGSSMKEAGSAMAEKLNEAVSVVKAAGQEGKKGMEAAKAAAKPAGGKPSATEGGKGDIGKGAEAGGGAEMGKEAEASGGTEMEKDAGADGGTEMGKEAEASGGTEMGKEAEAGEGTEIEKGVEIDRGTEMGKEVEADGGVEIEKGAEVSGGAEIGKGAEVGGGAEMGTDAEADGAAEMVRGAEARESAEMGEGAGAVNKTKMEDDGARMGINEEESADENDGGVDNSEGLGGSESLPGEAADEKIDIGKRVEAEEAEEAETGIKTVEEGDAGRTRSSRKRRGILDELEDAGAQKENK